MICFAACGAMLNIFAGRMQERSRNDLKKELKEELKGEKEQYKKYIKCLPDKKNFATLFSKAYIL